jgi:glycosyltransferase involved in cell wall biosynthesis
MRIIFYTPFKPMGHRHPSGDVVIAAGLYAFLLKHGHDVRLADPLRSRWIYWRPWLWPRLLASRRRMVRRLRRQPADLWLTYHSYYKAPDLLGPGMARRFRIPYVIFQGVYATKHRRDIRTWAGFQLNTRALRAADHVFTNKSVDRVNLRRVIAEGRLSYVAPGIYPEEFGFDARARVDLRREWGLGGETLVLSAAMFRRDVKTEGLMWLIRACAALCASGRRFFLAIAGEGSERKRLESLAAALLPGRVRFVGKLERSRMYRFYSAGDLFAFPGIRESLGMVYLEAQACGLPVVAFDNGGIPEVVRRDETGYLTPMHDQPAFTAAMNRLLTDPGRRRRMGDAAAAYVRRDHDLNRNYEAVQGVLEGLVGRGAAARRPAA